MNRIERKLYELVSILSEEGNPALDKEISYKAKDGTQKKIVARAALRLPKDHPAHVEADKIVQQSKATTAKEKPAEKPADKKPAEKPSEKKPSTPTTPAPQKAEPVKIAAADFRTDAEKNAEKGPRPGVDLGKSFDKMKDTQKQGPKGVVTGDKLKDLMPGMDTSKKSINDVPPEAKKEAVTMIDKIANDLIKAKETGEKAPNTNLCVVTVPGTNLYCDGNKNIPRDQMPQFRGKPEPGSEADKMQRDKNGEVETSHIFDKMLADQGIKVSKPTPVPPDSLKATQSELVGPKVIGMMGVLDKDCNNQKCDEKDQQDYKNITDAIYVSNDGYVVDGHHRWAAITSHNIKNPDKQIPMNVRVIDDKIDSIIPKANKFAQDIGIAPKSGKEGTKGGPPAAQTKPMAEKKKLSLANLLKGKN